MIVADVFTIAAVAAGVVFFVAGTLGLVRFPDTASRLHALSKADNVGLGLVVIGLVPQAASLADAAKLVLVWLIAQLSAATAAQLIGRIAVREGRRR